MPERPAPRVRVVVLNWNSAWFTRRCLKALALTEYPSDRLEVVLVDNASVDGSLEQLRHSFPHIHVVANADNLGFAEGCNRAMRDLREIEFVALVNNDAVPEPGWLQPLVDALDVDPDAGAAAVRLVLEPAFTVLDLELAGGTAVIASVRLGEVEVLDRALASGLRSVGRPAWPMDLDHHLDDSAELLLPAGPGPRMLRLLVTGSGELVARTGADERRLRLDGTSQLIEMAAGEDREERLNGLGTDLSEDCEGFDRLYGEPVGAVGGPAGQVVPGFCGGGVLLRTEMLRQIGVFDPAYFAYYEDTDLSWRARRAGWHTVAVPDSVVRHAFGGSAGSRARGFFFLNYRNWMMTVMRNATPAQRRVAARSAWDRIKWAVRANIGSALKHRRRPALRLVAAWARVVLAGALAWPRIRRSRRLGTVGARGTDRVRGCLQPNPEPRAPGARPGGPLVVYLDLTGTDRGSGPALLAAGLGDVEPRIDLVTLVAACSPTGYRRATPAEWANWVGVSEPTLRVLPDDLLLPSFSPGAILMVPESGSSVAGPTGEPLVLRVRQVSPDGVLDELSRYALHCEWSDAAVPLTDPVGADVVEDARDPMHRLACELVERHGTP